MPSSAHTALAEDLAGMWALIQARAGGEMFEALAEADLPLSHLRLLKLLAGASADLAVGELAEEVGMSFAATSRAVEVLHRRGLADRREDPADRRTKRLRVTPSGRELLARIDASRLSGLTHFVESLTPREREALAAAVAPVLRRAAETQEAA